jgi:hypothetical protein
MITARVGGRKIGNNGSKRSIGYTSAFNNGFEVRNSLLHLHFPERKRPSNMSWQMIRRVPGLFVKGLRTQRRAGMALCAVEFTARRRVKNDFSFTPGFSWCCGVHMRCGTGYNAGSGRVWGNAFERAARVAPDGDICVSAFHGEHVYG